MEEGQGDRGKVDIPPSLPSSCLPFVPLSFLVAPLWPPFPSLILSQQLPVGRDSRVELQLSTEKVCEKTLSPSLFAPFLSFAFFLPFSHPPSQSALSQNPIRRQNEGQEEKKEGALYATTWCAYVYILSLLSRLFCFVFFPSHRIHQRMHTSTHTCTLFPSLTQNNRRHEN